VPNDQVRYLGGNNGPPFANWRQMYFVYLLLAMRNFQIMLNGIGAFVGILSLIGLSFPFPGYVNSVVLIPWFSAIPNIVLSLIPYQVLMLISTVLSIVWTRFLIKSQD
jgi:hypothetical protein